MFKKIDRDNSGSIDSSELYACISDLFPNAQFTSSDVLAMMKEADLNNDGVISLEEFVIIMTKAEGENSLWGKTQASMWTNVQRNTAQVIAVVDHVAAPMREMARQHSYRRNDGVVIASVGARAASFLLGFFSFALFYILYTFVVTMVRIAQVPGHNALNIMSKNTLELLGMDEGEYMNFSFYTYASCVIVWVIINLVIMLTSGCTIEMYLMGLRLVDRDTCQKFSVLGLIVYLFLFNVFNAICLLEAIVLLFTGRTISERIVNAIMIVQ